MIDALHLHRFKNLKDATLTLGPFTVLIGANASGKSNIRDAFLSLHGIGRGYSLAEILGEKCVGGERVWGGIRGGVRELAYFGSGSFELVVALRLPPEGRTVPPVEYRIEVSVAEPAAKAPRKDFGFLDLSPPQMRIPSQPGQTRLGDRGENLSSVLAAICADASRKEILLEWVRKLSPMGVDDLLFDQDAAGRILLRLVEKDGRSVSALSASDGTLRFLAILAALFGPEPASFYSQDEEA
ncbi:MAG: AAA family ATPase [Isosphaerales bacterium]